MAENDGGGNTNAGEAVERPQWMDSLPDAHKNNESFYQFKEPAQAWDRFHSFLKAEGNTVVIPGEGATDEERQAFYARLGRPESPDKYSFKKPDGLPEGMAYSEDLEKSFRTFAHNKGISDADATAIFNWYYSDVIKPGFDKMQADTKAAEETRARDSQQAREKAISDLKAQYKTEEEFKGATELAVRTFQKFGGEEGKKFVEEAKIDGLPLGDHPAFIKLFSEIGKVISDDSMNAGQHMGTGPTSDEEIARAMFPNTKWQT